MAFAVSRFSKTSLFANNKKEFQIRHGGNLKRIRDRIKTVKTVEKITKTMKMIANSRVRGAQNRLAMIRNFNIDDVFRTEQVETNKKGLLFAFTSDRGLCGALNSSVVKKAIELIKDRENAGGNVQVVGFGEKSTQFSARKYGDRLQFQITDLNRKPASFLGASMIVDRALKMKPEGYDSVTFVYNHFNNLISYSTIYQDIFSYDAFLKVRGADLAKYEFEDESQSSHFRDFYEFIVASKVLTALVETNTSELSARVQAMENASKNCKELIKKLTLMYNRKRQANITTELTEIIAGTEAAL